MPRLLGGSCAAGASMLGIAFAAACASGRAAPPPRTVEVPAPSAAPAAALPPAAPTPDPPQRAASCPVPARAPMGTEPDSTCRGEQGCEQACDGGSAAACVTAGNLVTTRHPDPARELRLYARACRLGNVLGCTNYGATIRLADHDASDLACAAQLFALACDHGEADGCAMLGGVYVRGEGVPRDGHKALLALLRGCRPSLAHKDGVVMACHELIALLQATASRSADPLAQKATEQARRTACKAGSAADCTAQHRATP